MEQDIHDLGVELILFEDGYGFTFEDAPCYPVGQLLLDFCNTDFSTIFAEAEKYPDSHAEFNKNNADYAQFWLQNIIVSKCGIVLGRFLVLELMSSAYQCQLDGNTMINLSIDSEGSHIDEKNPIQITDIRDFFLYSLAFLTMLQNYVSDYIESYIEGDSSFIKEMFFSTRKFRDQDIHYAIVYVKEKLVPIYTFVDVVSMIRFELCNIMEKKVIIKNCANCDRFFVPLNRSDTIYCDNPSPQDPTKTCKAIGATIARQTKERTDMATNLYRSIYMYRQMKAKRNPDIPAYKEAFEWYKTETKQWKADVKAGKRTEAEFIEWLKKVKEQKV